MIIFSIFFDFAEVKTFFFQGCIYIISRWKMNENSVLQIHYLQYVFVDEK